MFVITLPKSSYARLAMGVLVLFSLLDAWNFLSPRFMPSAGGFLKFSSFVRIFFEIGILGLLWKDRFKMSTQTFQLFCISLILIGTSTLGFLLFQLRFPFNIPLSNFGICLNKYLFVFVCFYFLKVVFSNTHAHAQKSIYQVYEFIVYGNCASALIGMVLNLWWMKTYIESDRWGYQGAFTLQVNEASLFSVISLFYGIVVLVNEKRKLPFLAAVISTLLLGSKAAWGLMLVVNFWLIWRFYPKAGRLFLIVFVLVALFLMDVIIEKISEVPAVAFFIELSKSGYPIEKIIFSSRNELIEQAWLNLEYWGPANYLLGGGGLVTWGIGLPKWQTLITELDVFDVPLFFGIAGTILYIKGYLLIVQGVSRKFRTAFLVSFFLLACLSGHVFNSSINSLYLVLFLLKSQENTDNATLSST